MAARYKHTTLETFRNSIKRGLGDYSAVQWPVSEIDTSIKESLLTFGALSGFWKEDILIETQNAKRIYDIYIDTKTGTYSLAPTLTYGDIINWLNRDLIESISVGTPTSILFTLEEWLSIINEKYNKYLLDTNLVIKKVEATLVAQNNLVKLSDELLDSVRLKFKYSLNSIDYEVVLERSDEESIAQFDEEALTEEGIPLYYSTVYGSPNELKVYPIPNVTGTLEILYVGTRDLTAELSVDTIIYLPNNLVPYLKYAVLADIHMRDGLLNDPNRAKYYTQRLQEGTIIGKNYASLLTVKSNGKAIDSDSIHNMDIYSNAIAASDDAPTLLGLAGLNIFEIDNLPNTTVNSILASCIVDAPIPVNDSDWIDVEIEYINCIANYCIHILHAKSGIAMISATSNYLQDFLMTAVNHNKRLQNRGITYKLLLGKAKKEESELPRIPVEA